MDTGIALFENLEGITCEIPIKFVTFNEFLNMAKTSPFLVASYKKKIESQINLFIRNLPEFNKVTILFLWIEENQRRDPDNIAVARKFILDALVKAGKLKDDRQKFIRGLFDIYDNGSATKVILKIVEEK